MKIMQSAVNALVWGLKSIYRPSECLWKAKMIIPMSTPPAPPSPPPVHFTAPNLDGLGDDLSI